MVTRLAMPSPTPANIADAFRSLVLDRAAAVAGKDGRLTANEAQKDPFVADAFARLGKKKPALGPVADAARAAMLTQAASVDGGDGRVSTHDAQAMSPIFLQAFQALRGKEAAVTPEAFAQKLGKLADGLLYMSESDDPYTPFHVKLDKSTPLTAATLKTALVWDAEEGDDVDEYDPYPGTFELHLDPHEDFFSDVEGMEPAEAAKSKAVDKAMRAAFTESSGVDSNGHDKTAKIWSVTVREEDSSRAPYYVFGRLENGDLVGLKTWRTWT